MEEMAAGFPISSICTDEEKYRIVEADRISERYQRIEQAVYEFIEVSKVGADAQKAQTESNEKLYGRRLSRNRSRFFRRNWTTCIRKA